MQDHEPAAQETVTFTDHTLDTAPEGSRGAIAAACAKFGFVPSAMARLAESPSAVAAFGKISSAWESTSLTHVEREVLAVTASAAIGCEVCVAIHSGILAGDPEARVLVEPLERKQPLADVRLEALRCFTLAVIASRGAVSDADLARFVAAGFTRRQALDVVVGVATYTLTGYANRLTRAPVDEALRSLGARDGHVDPTREPCRLGSSAAPLVGGGLPRRSVVE
jgi:uncharacterized peroxidase-related enzyme